MFGVSTLAMVGGEGQCVLAALEELECSGAHFLGPALQQVATTATGGPPVPRTCRPRHAPHRPSLMPLPFTCLPGLLRLRLSRCTHLLEHSLHSLVYVCVKLTHLDLSHAWQVVTDATATVIAHNLRCGLATNERAGHVPVQLVHHSGLSKGYHSSSSLSVVHVTTQPTASATSEPLAQEPRPEPSPGPDRPGPTGAALRHLALPAGREEDAKA